MLTPSIHEFSLQLQMEQIENYKHNLPPGTYDAKLTYLINKYNEFIAEARRGGYKVSKEELPLPKGKLAPAGGPIPYSEVWREKPVSVDEFIESENFLNLGGRIYRNIVNLAREWARPDIREGEALLGKGSGKSTLTALEMSLGLHQIMCLNDWRNYYQLPIGNICVLNLSTSQQQAEKVIFANLKNMVTRCKWFKQFDFDIKKREIDFGDERYAMSGHSGSTAWVGYNVLVGVLDEADKLMDNDKRIVAQELHDVLLSQAKSRFVGKYKIFSISSLGGYGSYMHRRCKVMELEGVARPEVIVRRSCETK